ncbi:hypothetical protein L6164_022577 [Bauhinia variegata]|uniref:Uncharacterized protein n=1 Tax=Bauhinia variegata TaxID=167791 RepID=A0ACB9MFM4_BAUVA|nr:hypothetical protein L6164_022577 [Bauhinia variegata]
MTFENYLTADRLYPIDYGRVIIALISSYVLRPFLVFFCKDHISMEQNLLEPACLDSNEDVSLRKNMKSISTETTVCASDNDNDCFGCNICLDSAQDPVVTLCGHLYCWPCIYKWLQVQSSSDESEQRQKCPVCKADISHTSLVPLYGRGNSASEAKRTQMGLGIPKRPPPNSLNSLLNSVSASTSHPGQRLHPNHFQPQPHPFQYQQYFPPLYGGYAANGSPYHGDAAMAAVFGPMIGMVGKMVFAIIFGNSDANSFSYPHSRSGRNRMRRLEMQADKSLNRYIYITCSPWDAVRDCLRDRGHV